MCKFYTWEMQEKGSGVQDWPWLNSKVEASLGYLRLWFEREGKMFMCRCIRNINLTFLCKWYLEVGL